ncbi:MAG: B-box zinc finger protein [Planctomycetes bacterium]|nr:B-box zinc finger protein [Planctomycetota bacterium]
MTAGPRCVYHPEAPAAYACDGCGSFVCRACLKKGGTGKICADCAAAGGAPGRRDLVAESRVRAVGLASYGIALAAFATLLFKFHDERADLVWVFPLATGAVTPLAVLGEAVRRFDPRARVLLLVLVCTSFLAMLVRFAATKGDPLVGLGALVAAAGHAGLLWGLFGKRASRLFVEGYALLVRRHRHERPPASALAYLLVGLYAVAFPCLVFKLL